MLAPIGALLDPRVGNVKFFTNFSTKIFNSSLGQAGFYALARLRLRDMSASLLSVWITLTQNSTYGLHVSRCSREAGDAELARRLYEWTDAEVSKY